MKAEEEEKLLPEVNTGKFEILELVELSKVSEVVVVLREVDMVMLLKEVDMVVLLMEVVDKGQEVVSSKNLKTKVKALMVNEILREILLSFFCWLVIPKDYVLTLSLTSCWDLQGHPRLLLLCKLFSP